jgi:hypothetical protein
VVGSRPAWPALELARQPRAGLGLAQPVQRVHQRRQPLDRKAVELAQQRGAARRRRGGSA